MNAAVVLLIGSMFGVGVALVARSLAPAGPHWSPPRRPWWPGWRVRLAPAVAGAMAGGLVTRWPVAVAAGAAAGWFARDLLGRRPETAEGVARTEAIAGWTEMLRDTLAGAQGLEAAIVTTAPLAPVPIRAEIAALGVRLRDEPLADVMPEFAAALAHPTGDLVTTALAMAATGGIRDVGRLLSTLAASARAEAALRQRIEASRAKTRAAVRSVAACTAIAVGGLLAFKRPYLAPYGSPQGQVVLGLVCVTFAGGLAWLARLSQSGLPERYLVVGRDEGRRP